MPVKSLTHEDLIFIIDALRDKLHEVENDPDFDEESNEVTARKVQWLLDSFEELEADGIYPVVVRSVIK